MGQRCDTTGEQIVGYLANVSHELRSPLNAVLGMLELALGERLSEPLREYLSTAHRAARSLVVSLNDVTDLARIEAGEVDLAVAPVDIRSTVLRAIRSVQLAAQDRGVRLKVDFADGVPKYLEGDARRLQQLVANVAEHALRTSVAGELVLAVDATGCGDGDVELVMHFCEQDHRPFNMGPTADDIPYSRDFSGECVGMVIARRLASRMRGRVWTDPTGGGRVGLCVRLSPAVLPDELDLPDSSENTTKEEYPMDMEAQTLDRVVRPLDILVADDTPANQRVVQAILTKRGHRVALAGNGREALDLVNRRPFDVVLMDAQMPLMNGLEATAAIRKLADPRRAAVPIVAMTAHAMHDDRRRCLEAGMDDYLTKPVRVATLVECVETHAAQRHPGGSAIADENATLLDRFGGDRALVGELSRLFCQDAPGMLTEIGLAIAAADPERTGRAAHNLRGLAANFEASNVVEPLAEIERHARANKLDEAGAVLASLGEHLDALCGSLRSWFADGAASS